METLAEKQKRIELSNNKVVCSKYFIVRLDGKNFSKRTKLWKLNKPFDINFYDSMIYSCIKLMSEISDIKFIWTGSDEISILFKEYGDEEPGWYGRRYNKILSISSSITTAFFNIKMKDHGVDISESPAFFDSRIIEFENKNDFLSNIIYRQNDCIRNSISTYALDFFKSKFLNGKNSEEKIELMKNKGYDWELESPDWTKYGSILYKDLVDVEKGGIKYKRTETKIITGKFNMDILNKVYDL